jgi:MFS family permease
MAIFSSPRSAIMLVFAGFGVAAGSWAGAVPFVTQRLAISNYDLGIGFAAAALATAFVMSLGGRIGSHISNRAALLVGLPLVAASTWILLTAASPPVFFASLVAQAALLGFCDTFMNAEASAIEHDLRRPVFTAFHGAVSLAIAAAAIVSSFVSASYGPVYVGAIAAICLAMVMFAVFRNVPARSSVARRRVSILQMAVNKPLLLMGLIAGISITMETSAMFWSAKLLESQAPELAKIAGLGVAFYGLCNAAVRFNGDKLRARFGEFPLLLISLAVAIIGLAGLGVSLSFATNVVSFALIGFGLALICPTLFNMAASAVPHNRAGGIGFISLVAGVPRVLGPYAFGWVASVYSTGTAFGLGSVLLMMALCLILVLRAVHHHDAAIMSVNRG